MSRSMCGVFGFCPLPVPLSDPHLTPYPPPQARFPIPEVQRTHWLPEFIYAAVTYQSTELGVPATWCVRSRDFGVLYFCI
jgi:hypothetical protein